MMEFPNDSAATMLTSMNKSDEVYMQDSGIVSNVDTGGLISEIGTTTPTVYGEYDDLDLLDYVEQNDFVGIDQNFGEKQIQLDDSPAVFDPAAENQSCYRTEQENPIPNLIKLICDEDLVVVHQAAQMILQLAKKETSNTAITNNPEIFIALIRTLANCNDVEITRIVITILSVVPWNVQTCCNAVLNNREIIPTLMRIFAVNNDLKTKIVTCEILNNCLSWPEACSNIIANFPELPLMLIQTADNSNDINCIQKTLEVLSKISKDKKGCTCMNNSKTVSILVCWLSRFIDTDTMRLCVKVLYNLSKEKEVHRGVGSNESKTLSSDMSNNSICEKDSSAVVNNHDVLVAMMRILSITNESETIRAAANTLHNISCSPQGLDNIWKYDGIPALFKCLGTPSALATIHNLVLFKEGSVQAICEAGGLHKMVSLLRTDNVKFLTIVADILFSLVCGNEQNKLIFLELNGPAELIRILRTYHYEKLLWTVSKVLRVLSVCTSNKQAIVHAGGMQAMAMHLDYAKVASPRLVETVLWTLRNLSDAAIEIDGVEQLLHATVQFLNHGDEFVVMYAAGVLCNMTCNNQRNKLTVCRAGGIDALIRAISVAGSCEKITEPAVCALRHVTSRHSESQAAQNEVRLCFGIDVIMNLLRPSSGWPLIKAVIGLLRNLASCPANQETLREHSAVQHLGNLLTFTVNELRKQNNGGGANNMLEGKVRLEEIIEGSIGALQVLSRDPVNRDIMQAQQIVSLLTELFFDENESIQRMATSILWEFGEHLDDLPMMPNL